MTEGELEKLFLALALHGLRATAHVVGRWLRGQHRSPIETAGTIDSLNALAPA